MTKKIFCAIMAVMLSTIAFGQSGKSAKEVRQQNFVFGPKVSLYSPMQNAVSNTTAITDMINGLNPGIQMGGYMRGIIPFKKSKFLLYAQLEAAWAMDFYVGGGGNASEGVVYIPLTLGCGYKLTSDITLRIDGGAGYNINCYNTANPSFKGENDKYAKDLAELIVREPWGWLVNVGADWKDWVFDIRYQNQFKSKSTTRMADEARFSSIGIVVGYKF